jgi:hypothetical protein
MNQIFNDNYLNNNEQWSGCNKIKDKLTIDFLKKHPHYDINKQYGPFLFTLLMISAANNDQDLVKFLLEKKNINAKIKNKFGETVLVYVIRSRNREMIKLLSNDMYSDKININDYNIVNDYGNKKACYGPVLSYAIEQEDFELVKLILKNKNIDVNINLSGGFESDCHHLNNFSPINCLNSHYNNKITNLIFEYNKELIDSYENNNHKSKVTLWDYIETK